ncbi:toll/interleukin-1 receptor domain-containing protein [Planctomicrobium sp. SH661]|uniref:toll/interleukin-1 receptor domain-containing protein n=1 Tax=Planctomicrobium sp. SH661 TaxID=3448124 RepID=UPI003F5BA82F
MGDTPLKHIFVSHAGPDRALADQLAADLRDAGHETKVDTRELKLGDDSIDFMNEAIADAHTVIILYSQHTPKARWQMLEINASLWNEVAQDGGTCILVRLDDTAVPPLLGPKVYGKLEATSGLPYQKLIEDLCRAVLPAQPASSIVASAFGSSASNPFRRVRAEFFEDSPDLLARTFAPPDASKVGALEDMKPCLLEGSRGTGKSMLLLSLRGRNYLSRAAAPKTITIFGSYLKLTRGALCNAGLPLSASTDPYFGAQAADFPVVDISAQEIFIAVLESLVSELEYCIEHQLLSCNAATESRLANALGRLLFSEDGSRFARLNIVRDELGDAHRKIADFIRRRFIYGESPLVPFTTFDITLLRNALRVIRQEVTPLATTLFAVLLDEYENLFPFQQRIVNGLVKLAAPDLTVKIAKKLGTADTSATVMGQELQEIHDYTRIPLVYDVEDSHQLAAYQQLLETFVRNTLASNGFIETPLETLLPRNLESEVAEEDRRVEVLRLCKITPEEFESWEPRRQREKLTYYGEAAIYRCLYGRRGRRRDKRFSGTDDLVFLSSGVIRYFQEFLGVAFHLGFPSGAPTGMRLEIAPDLQSRAVHIVSRHNIATLSRNVEADGEVIKYLLLDVGDALRHKLLKHGSEPEAARLTLTDPERLSQPDMSDVRRILTVAVREGIFQSKDGFPAFRPKHDSDPQPIEINICRLFGPALQISPRLRWRTPITCADMRRLIDPNTRSETLAHLKRLWAGASPAKTGPSLFGQGGTTDEA